MYLAALREQFMYGIQCHFWYNQNVILYKLWQQGILEIRGIVPINIIKDRWEWRFFFCNV